MAVAARQWQVAPTCSPLPHQHKAVVCSPGILSANSSMELFYYCQLPQQQESLHTFSPNTTSTSQGVPKVVPTLTLMPLVDDTSVPTCPQPPPTHLACFSLVTKNTPCWCHHFMTRYSSSIAGTTAILSCSNTRKHHHSDCSCCPCPQQLQASQPPS